MTPARRAKPVKANLLKTEWAALESYDLRVLIETRIGGPGQISGKPGDNPSRGAYPNFSG